MSVSDPRVYYSVDWCNGEYHNAGCSRLSKKHYSSSLLSIVGHKRGATLGSTERYPCQLCKAPIAAGYTYMWRIPTDVLTFHSKSDCAELKGSCPYGVESKTALALIGVTEAKLCGVCAPVRSKRKADAEEEEVVMSQGKFSFDFKARFPSADETKKTLLLKAKEEGREFPFQVWDQVTLIKDKDFQISDQYKRVYNAPFLVVKAIHPCNEGPVISWFVTANVLGEDTSIQLPGYRFRLLCKHNDPTYRTRYDSVY